jgi:hypothetical protein
MPWSILPFGRHKGKTLPQVLFTDPDWFFWAVETKLLASPRLVGEAAVVDRRARNIRIPSSTGEDLVVEYIIHPQSRKFVGMQFVSRDHPWHDGSSPTRRADVIDMSVPRGFAEYDKLGGKLFIRELKRLLFGSKKYVMTRERAEAFFDDPGSFRGA